jgi:hypothetical protein
MGEPRRILPLRTGSAQPTGTECAPPPLPVRKFRQQEDILIPNPQNIACGLALKPQALFEKANNKRETCQRERTLAAFEIS